MQTLIRINLISGLLLEVCKQVTTGLNAVMNLSCKPEWIRSSTKNSYRLDVLKWMTRYVRTKNPCACNKPTDLLTELFYSKDLAWWHVGHLMTPGGVGLVSHELSNSKSVDDAATERAGPPSRRPSNCAIMQSSHIECKQSSTRGWNVWHLKTEYFLQKSYDQSLHMEYVGHLLPFSKTLNKFERKRFLYTPISLQMLTFCQINILLGSHN